MRSSFTPEEVDRIEEKAYEVGESVGRGLERERIIALLEAELLVDDDGTIIETHRDALIALIKGEVAERRQSQMSEYGDKGKKK